MQQPNLKHFSTTAESRRLCSLGKQNMLAPPGHSQPTQYPSKATSVQHTRGDRACVQGVKAMQTLQSRAVEPAKRCQAALHPQADLASSNMMSDVRRHVACWGCKKNQNIDEAQLHGTLPSRRSTWRNAATGELSKVWRICAARLLASWAAPKQRICYDSHSDAAILRQPVRSRLRMGSTVRAQRTCVPARLIVSFRVGYSELGQRSGEPVRLCTLRMRYSVACKTFN